MIRAAGERFELGQWSFVVPESAGNLPARLRKDLVDNTAAALDGKRGPPFRRSRHATTWRIRIVGLSGEPINVFVKQVDPPRGLASRAKAAFRAKRSEHVLRISEDLRRDNFGVPQVLLIGVKPQSGHEVIVMRQAPGFMLTRWMNPMHHRDVTLRRRILYKLGAEVGRLHLAGYIHGDLTPYNIFATDDSDVAITFIDHEGTQKISRASLNVARNRLRNLVQLGHFNIPGVSRTDKMRVFVSYAAKAGLTRVASRRGLARLIRMIARRRKRDRAIKRDAPQPAIIAEEGGARS